MIPALRLKFHVLVGAKIFNHNEAESFVKAVRVVVEHEDHVAERLPGLGCLVHQPAQKQSANAPILKFFEQRNVQQTDLFFVAADPGSPSALVINHNHVVPSTGKARVIFASLKFELPPDENFLLAFGPLSLCEFFCTRGGVESD